MTRGEKAENLFMQGYNCSQAVFLAFADMYPFDFDTAAMLSSSFGGGMGRLREVCGTVSGIFLAAGTVLGYSNPRDVRAKTDHYALIQKLAAEFKKENGSIICRELLGLKSAEDSFIPDERTPEYYKKRPCPKLCKAAADILEKELSNRGIFGNKSKN